MASISNICVVCQGGEHLSHLAFNDSIGFLPRSFEFLSAKEDVEDIAKKILASLPTPGDENIGLVPIEDGIVIVDIPRKEILSLNLFTQASRIYLSSQTYARTDINDLHQAGWLTYYDKKGWNTFSAPSAPFKLDDTESEEWNAIGSVHVNHPEWKFIEFGWENWADFYEKVKRRFTLTHDEMSRWERWFDHLRQCI